jgi:hypothetical protein
VDFSLMDTFDTSFHEKSRRIKEREGSAGHAGKASKVSTRRHGIDQHCVSELDTLTCQGVHNCPGGVNAG